MIATELPNKWGTRRLDEVVLLLDSGTWGDPATRNSGLPVLRSTNIQDWLLDLTTDVAYRSVPERDKQRKKLENGDIIVTKSSGSLHLIGEAALFEVDTEATTYLFSNFIQRLRPNPNVISPKYLHRYLKSTLARGVINEMQRTTSGLRNLKVQEYSAQHIPIPYPNDPTRSLAEQRRIVERLEALLGEVREMRKLQAEIEADVGRLMDSVLAEVFDPTTMQSWAFDAELDALVEINAPLVDPTLPNYRDLPHINGEVIQEGTGRLLPYRTAAEDGMRSAKYLFSPGSVLYSKIRPYLRKTVTVDFTGLCSADMYPLELKTDDLSAEFLKWTLLSPHFTSYAVGKSGRARMPKINRAELFAYHLRYPSISEQDSITDLLDHVQEQGSEMEDVETEHRRLLEELEQSILAQAFRGEL